jgi:ABC-2 type transport system permease protein
MTADLTHPAAFGLIAERRTESAPSMGRLVRAELLKTATTRTGRVLAAVAVFVPLAYSLISRFTRDGIGASVQHTALTVDLMLVGLVVPVLGALMVTAEDRHRTIVPTTLAVPRRDRVLAAKYVAGVLTGVAVAAISLALMTGVTAALASTAGEPIAVTDGLVRAAFGGLAGLAAWTAAGVAVGSALRNSAAALSAVFLAATVLPAVVGSFWPSFVHWVQPLDAINVLGGQSDVMSVGQGIATLSALLAVPAAVGLVRQRKDLS